MSANFLSDVARFMRASGQSIDELRGRQLSLYFGLQCEELAEKISVLAEIDHTATTRLLSVALTLHSLGDELKAGRYQAPLETASREQQADLVDADFDLAWVSVGAMYSSGCRVPEAFREGTRSNLAKIGPGGTVAKDANGKVLKPAGWTSPDFQRSLF